MKKAVIVSIVSIFTLFVGCSKDEPVILETSSDVLNVNPLDSGQSVDISANKSWIAKSSAGWCTLSDSAGTGNKSIVVICQTNLTAISRLATITIQVEGKSKSVMVRQSAGNALMAEDFMNNTWGWSILSQMK